MEKEYKKILAAMAGIRLAVVGDSMVDRFVWGKVERISPEAPVPVVRVEDETLKLGGAANVAANIQALGAKVVLCSIHGQDAAAQNMADLLGSRGIAAESLTPCADRPTTLKTRIIAHNQQVVRTDYEVTEPVDAATGEAILAALDAAGPVDGIILSDYGKGVLTEEVLGGIILRGQQRGIPMVVDPKQGDFSQYRGVTSLTPNQKETEQACTQTITDQDTLHRAGQTLLQRTLAEAVLITRGEQGMALYQADGQEFHLPTRATKVFDVTGAGDTVIAVYTAALAAGAGFSSAAVLANYAAGLSVRELGTAAVTRADLGAALSGGESS